MWLIGLLKRWYKPQKGHIKQNQFYIFLVPQISQKSNTYQQIFTISSVTRNRKIVWKYGPNRPFYALMLRNNKLCRNPFFSTVHQNIDKKNWAVKTVWEPPLYLPMWLISGFFSFLCQNANMPGKIKLCQKSLQFFKERKIGTVWHTERRTKLEDHKVIF